MPIYSYYCTTCHIPVERTLHPFIDCPICGEIMKLRKVLRELPVKDDGLKNVITRGNIGTSERHPRGGIV